MRPTIYFTILILLSSCISSKPKHIDANDIKNYTFNKDSSHAMLLHQIGPYDAELIRINRSEKDLYYRPIVDILKEYSNEDTTLTINGYMFDVDASRLKTHSTVRDTVDFYRHILGNHLKNGRYKMTVRDHTYGVSNQINIKVDEAIYTRVRPTIDSMLSIKVVDVDSCAIHLKVTNHYKYKVLPENFEFKWSCNSEKAIFKNMPFQKPTFIPLYIYTRHDMQVFNKALKPQKFVYLTIDFCKDGMQPYLPDDCLFWEFSIFHKKENKIYELFGDYSKFLPKNTYKPTKHD